MDLPRNASFRFYPENSTADYDIPLDEIVESQVEAENRSNYFIPSFGGTVLESIYTGDRMCLSPVQVNGTNVLSVTRTALRYEENSAMVLGNDLRDEPYLPGDAPALLQGDGVTLNGTYTIRPSRVTGGMEFRYLDPVTPKADALVLSLEDVTDWTLRNRGEIDGALKVRGQTNHLALRFMDDGARIRKHVITVSDLKRSVYNMPVGGLTFVSAVQIDAADATNISPVFIRRLGVVSDGEREVAMISDGTIYSGQLAHHPVVYGTQRFYIQDSILEETLAGGTTKDYVFNPQTGEFYLTKVLPPGYVVTASYEYLDGGEGVYVDYDSGELKFAGLLLDTGDKLQVSYRANCYSRTLVFGDPTEV